MKLRIRYNKRTKALTLGDDPSPTVELLKQAIKENAFEEWGLSREVEFEVSLDGKSRIGDSTLKLKDAGIVSGDLIKVVLDGCDLAPSHSVEMNAVASEAMPAAPNNSEMSVGQADMQGTSSDNTSLNEIPCHSPGPIFFRECDGQSEVPHLVQKLYENDVIKNDFQALCIVMHFMMRESGFFIEGIDDQSDVLPLLQTRLFVTEYSHAAGNGLKLSFSCNQLGSYILVNTVVQPCVNTSEQVITLQVVSKDFIVQSFNGSNKNSNAAAVYKNLSKLNRQVKETVAHPALNNMREELQLPPLHGLLSLFPEILQFIFSFLDCKSLLALGQVNKSLQEIASDDNLWRNLYVKDFKFHPIGVQSSWKKVYERKYLHDKEQRREFNRIRRRHEDFTPPDFFAGPSFSEFPQPQPFGMIGGEHDLRPTLPYGPFSNPNRRLPPTRPHPMNPDNPLPGSRYDPIYPGGAFRPGRGGGLQDMDPFDSGFGGSGLPNPNRPHPGRRGFNQRFGFF